MSILFNKTSGIARGIKAFLNPKGGSTHGAIPDAGQRPSEQMKRIREELLQLKKELQATKDPVERAEYRKRIQNKKQEKFQLKEESFQLENKLRAVKEQEAEGEPDIGALPNFVIIGAQKCGTTSLYRFLIQHPYVEPPVTKELHFFDNLFEEGIDWYRRCFPPPVWKDGRRTITGEATPAYLFRPYVPERMAKVAPQARLITLLRNPVDRTYSHYHKQVRSGSETRTFEEVIEADKSHTEYLSRGIYVDQLLRWSRFFSDEQMLVLKSEDFFERPRETLKVVLDFLDLPEWEPESREIRHRHKGRYEQKMDPDTRRRLEEYFEPHNQRLYEYLGVDFGW